MNANDMVNFINRVWAERGYPKDELPVAMQWAGGIDRLARWLGDSDKDVVQVQRRLRREPMSDATKARIREAVANGATPLDVVRAEGITLAVVKYILKNEPTVDTLRRPWLGRKGA